MARAEGTDDLAGLLYDATTQPDGLFALVADWDSRISADDPEGSLRSDGFFAAAFLRHVERAHRVLDEMETGEFQGFDDLLAAVPFAAMMLTETGVVAAANAAARAAFGLYPGGSLRLAPAPRPEIEELLAAVAEIAGSSPGRDAVARFTPHEASRPVLVHLRGHGAGRSRRHVVAVCSELGWTEQVDALLARRFAMTAAETALVRHLAAGDRIRDIARAGGRSEGTVRSQLHSVLGKAGVASQGELVRLALTLLHAAALEPEAAKPVRDADHARDARRSVRLADGRRLAVLCYGDPAGRPALWLMSSLGLYQPTAAGERELRRRGRCLIVPIRAGYGPSDPPPPGRDVGATAVDDLVELVDRMGLARCPVVAPMHEIRTALAFVQRRPGQVERIVALGAAFPTSSMARFRRLRGATRVWVSLVRYAPHLAPFVVRAFHARIRKTGLAELLRGIFRDTPGDAAALADREIAEAVVGAFTYARCTTPAAQDAFLKDSFLAESPWPEGLGRVDCPVVLLHGEHDGVGPAATAREAAAENPGWRFVGFPDAGQLAFYMHWSRVLSAIDGDDGLPAAAQQAAE